MEIINIIERNDYEEIVSKHGYTYADISELEFSEGSMLIFVVYFIPNALATLAYRKVHEIEFDSDRNFEDLDIITDDTEAIFYTTERDKAGNTHSLPLSDDWQVLIKDTIRDHIDFPVVLSVNSE